MKTKELKKVAQRIAKLELVIEKSEDQDEIRKAQNEIMDLSGRIGDPEDLFRIDELVQEMLKYEKS